MVAAANPHATEAGLEILRAGGSAADAAVTVQLVLGLVEPQSSGLGGGAFLLHWSQSERRARGYDGRETAPAAAKTERFLDAAGKPLELGEAIVNGLSVGTPGVPRLLEEIHRRHGRLAWARLFEPAIRLAEQGFAISPRLHRMLEGDPALREDRAARALFYRGDGSPHPVGDVLRNPGYAATLRAIAQGGADAFYRGPIAQDMVLAVASHRRPGDLAAEDLARYRVIEREPVCGPYRGLKVCSMGPPAGGVTVLQILGILERTPFGRAAPDSAGAAHYFAEAARLAYADRARHVADPAILPQPIAALLDPAYLDRRARLVGERSMGRAEHGAGTTHFSIVDARGDAVAMTSSIESAFGSRILVRGFLLNNELTDFSFVPEESGRALANRVEPGKRPRSAMSPTLVFDGKGELQLAVGSAGGSAIIYYVAKALVAMIDWKLDAQQALARPNSGSRNGPTEIERGSAYEALAPALRALGHAVELLELTSGTHAVERTPGGWRGGADPRREGVARGD